MVRRKHFREKHKGKFHNSCTYQVPQSEQSRLFFLRKQTLRFCLQRDSLVVATAASCLAATVVVVCEKSAKKPSWMKNYSWAETLLQVLFSCLESFAEKFPGVNFNLSISASLVSFVQRLFFSPGTRPTNICKFVNLHRPILPLKVASVTQTLSMEKSGKGHLGGLQIIARY